MTTRKAFMDVIYQVGEEGECPLTIAPDPDAPNDHVRVYAKSAEDQAYWGKVDFILPKEIARKMGEALLLAAGEQA